MVTLENIEKEIRNLAKEYPEGIYLPSNKGCHYSIGVIYNGPETCGCIVGQAIGRIVPSLPKCMDDTSCQNWGSPSVEVVLSNYNIDFNSETSEWIREVQLLQDKCTPWSKCVEIADGKYRKVS